MWVFFSSKDAIERIFFLDGFSISVSKDNVINMTGVLSIKGKEKLISGLRSKIACNIEFQVELSL